MTRLVFRLRRGLIGMHSTPTYPSYFRDLDKKLTHCSNTRTINRIKSKAQNAITTFYPSLPSPRLPTTLPISAYAGTYTHPGYQSLHITVNSNDSGSETLHADRSFTTWSEPHLNFQHVSGDYFIIHAEHHSDLGALVPTVYPAEFVLGSDGSPKKVGIGYEEEMGKDGRIWFERV
jgi:hypothetical protein